MKVRSTCVFVRVSLRDHRYNRQRRGSHRSSSIGNVILKIYLESKFFPKSLSIGYYWWQTAHKLGSYGCYHGYSQQGPAVARQCQCHKCEHEIYHNYRYQSVLRVAKLCQPALRWSCSWMYNQSSGLPLTEYPEQWRQIVESPPAFLRVFLISTQSRGCIRAMPEAQNYSLSPSLFGLTWAM